MLNMDQKLIKRQEEGKIIKTGIVGAGQMGRGMVTQMVLMNGITPAIVSDIKVENRLKLHMCLSITFDTCIIYSLHMFVNSFSYFSLFCLNKQLFYYIISLKYSYICAYCYFHRKESHYGKKRN